MVTLRNIHLVLGALFLFSIGLDSVFAAVPGNGVLKFAIVRNGKEIGFQVYRFRQVQDAVEVVVSTRIKFKLGFITVHRLNHDSHEIWKKDRLVAFSSSTSEKNIVKGRTKYHVAVQEDGEDLSVEAAQDGWRAPTDAIPASFWNSEFVHANTLIDTVDGAKLVVTVEPLGNDVISVNGGMLDARHYRVSGDMERELWYDHNNVLVQVRFIADDGSEIQFVTR